MKTYKPLAQSEIEKIANNFLLSNDKRDGKRFMVVEVLESLGVTILPVDGLSGQGVEACLIKKKNHIAVDKGLMDADSPRYLFTLAEELAHSIIHIKGKTPNTLFKEVMEMPKHRYDYMERDAKRLAGAILMPAVNFRTLFREHLEWHQAQMRAANNNHCDALTSIKYAFRRLYQTFGVSLEGAFHRGRELELITRQQHKDLCNYINKGRSRY